MALPYLFYISFPFMIVCILIFLFQFEYSLKSLVFRQQTNSASQNVTIANSNQNQRMTNKWHFLLPCNDYISRLFHFLILILPQLLCNYTCVHVIMRATSSMCFQNFCNKISICVWHASVCYCICVVILFSLLFVVHCIILQLAIGKLDVFLVEIFLMCKFCDIVFFLLLFRFFFLQQMTNATSQ